MMTINKQNISGRSCRLCADTRLRTLYEFSCPAAGSSTEWLLTVLQCKSCKLVFLSQTEELVSAQSYYEFWWEKMWGPVYREHNDAVQSTIVAQCKLIEHIMGKIGRLLDLGCGDGTFLATAQSCGWDISGIEVTEAAAQRAREKVGKNHIFQTLEEVEFSNRTFDVITLWDVIEHVPDPVEILRRLGKILRTEGRVILLSPNADSLIHRAAHFIYQCTLKSWIFPLRLIYVPGHLYYFTFTTIGKALACAGLSQVKLTKEIEIPKGLFDNLDALFSANKREGWTRLPFFKLAISGMLSASRWMKRPYRMLIVAQKEKEKYL